MEMYGSKIETEGFTIVIAKYRYREHRYREPQQYRINSGRK